MNRDPLNEALDQISDRHLSEAMEPKKPRRMFWLGAVAALLALVIGLSPLMPKPGYTLETTPPQTAPELVQVDIFGNPVYDVSSLTKLSIIVNYNPV